jgi:hypothetical protein
VRFPLLYGLVGKSEDVKQPLGNRVGQDEDKVRERQGSDHRRNSGPYQFPSRPPWAHFYEAYLRRFLLPPLSPPSLGGCADSNSPISRVASSTRAYYSGVGPAQAEVLTHSLCRGSGLLRAATLSVWTGKNQSFGGCALPLLAATLSLKPLTGRGLRRGLGLCASRGSTAKIGRKPSAY